jgi:hypothetical protein
MALTIYSNDSSYIPEEDLENLLAHQPSPNGAFSDVMHHELPSPNWARILCLFHRLFEAHFLPVHMMILVISSSLYVIISSDAQDDLNMRWIFQTMAILRVVGFLAVGFYMALYESYHSICVHSRKSEMKVAGLYESMAGAFSHRSWRTNFCDYVAIPLVAPLFGSIPAVQAQMCHFWTLDLVYAVSRKPQPQSRVREKEGGAIA